MLGAFELSPADPPSVPGAGPWQAAGARACSRVTESDLGFPNWEKSDSRCWLEWRPARMTRPYSLDLRERVAARVVGGASCRTVAALFGVSVSSAVRWSQRQRDTGSAAAKPMGGKRPLVLAGERDWLLARIAAKPDVTLRALVTELAERGIVVSLAAVWTFFAREKISFKKKPARRRAGSRRRGAPTGAMEKIPRPA